MFARPLDTSSCSARGQHHREQAPRGPTGVLQPIIRPFSSNSASIRRRQTRIPNLVSMTTRVSIPMTGFEFAAGMLCTSRLPPCDQIQSHELVPRIPLKLLQSATSSPPHCILRNGIGEYAYAPKGLTESPQLTASGHLGGRFLLSGETLSVSPARGARAWHFPTNRPHRR
jgi:hypothetical protein